MLVHHRRNPTPWIFTTHRPRRFRHMELHHRRGLRLVTSLEPQGEVAQEPQGAGGEGHFVTPPGWKVDGKSAWGKVVGPSHHRHGG